MTLSRHSRDRMTRIRHQVARDLHDFCVSMIQSDGRAVPAEQRAWKTGQTHSWHYVRAVEYRTQQFIHYLENISMARKQGKKNGTSFGGDYKFVKAELRAEEKPKAKAWIEANTTNLGPILSDVVASDYKFSLSFSQDHDTFTACLTGKEDNAINAFKILTARHKDWQVATLTVLYKHGIMFKQGVWESAEDTEDDGWA